MVEGVEAVEGEVSPGRRGQTNKNLVNLHLIAEFIFNFVKTKVLLADKSVVAFSKASILSNLL